MISRPYASGLYAQVKNAARLVDMKTTLEDLNRQLSTGKRSATFAGLDRRATALSIRSQLADMTGYKGVASRGEIRASVMSNALEAIRAAGADQRTDANASLTAGTMLVPGLIQAQAKIRFDTVISALNTDYDGQYLFSGANASQKPLASAIDMINGTAGAAGLRQLIDERTQADLGSGLGRLSVAQAGTAVTVSEESAGLPFGLKIAGVSGTMAGASVAGSDPDVLTVNLASQPNTGDTINISLTLPDGSSESISLVAGGTSSNGFAIGATTAATAANLAASIGSALGTVASTKLAGASAVIASNDFFAGTSANPPRRVDGPPFGTATGYAAAGSRPTVLWYNGEDGAGDPRDTQIAVVDRGVAIGVGARANEQPLRDVLAGIAAIILAPGDAEGFRAVAGRVSPQVNALNQSVAGKDLITDIGVARQGMKQAIARHGVSEGVLGTALADIEDAPIEEVSASILSLQTRLQASYQATATISRLNLADYLG